MLDFKIPPVLKWIGGIAALLTASATAWVQFGGAVPITKHSPVVEALHETDRDYAGQFQINGLEISRINAEILQAHTARLENSIESDSFLLGQFDHPDLTEGERFAKNRLLRRIAKHERELDRLDKK